MTIMLVPYGISIVFIFYILNNIFKIMEAI